MNKKVILYLFALTLFLTTAINSSLYGQMATNPIIYADVPDPDFVRVGDTYYMTSTTMHFNPGIPIMKSKDLVNWSLVNYCYPMMASTDALNLNNGQEAYSGGTWASSINFKNGTYYVSSFSYTTGKTYIYKTTNIETGPWTTIALNKVYHDHSLFFDDDGKVYFAYGHDDIWLTEMKPDLTGEQTGGVNKIIISKASSVAGTSFILTAEGTHLQKINGMYYVSNICWPSGKGRTQIIHRSNTVAGTYTGQVAFQSSIGSAQGEYIDTPDGKWYAMFFHDNGSVGRSPDLIPVVWSNGWPTVGVNGQVPSTLDIVKGSGSLRGIIDSDEFSSATPLKLQWQWNHNPNNTYWSMTQRSGYMRLTNERTDANVLHTTNTLTQRTYGPKCSGYISIDVSGMKDGDYSGLMALQNKYGFVGVKMNGTSKTIVMVNGTGFDGVPVEAGNIPLSQNTVYLRVDFDFTNKTDKAYFYYSLNGTTWTAIGSTLQMNYDLEHFTGYRFGLFNYATKSSGGYTDFNFFRVGANITEAQNSGNTNSSPTVYITSPANNAAFTAPASITINANASDADGTVSNVEFFNGTTLLGSDVTSPYSFIWSNVAAGTYTITARATDNTGAVTTSAASTVTVNNACTPSAITPYLQINGGTWVQTNNASLNVGGGVTFGPQPTTGGSWQWTGPNGFTAFTREILVSNIQSNQAGNYVATYTNSGGCKSASTFALTLTIPVTSTTIKSPAMGWASWNQFGLNINESIIKQQADAMVSSGLFSKGFKNINIDDGFFNGRNSDGSLSINASKFPNGMKYIADYIHSKGLLAGFYSEAGSNTCGNVYGGQTGGLGGGMYNHDQQDADLFFKTWGFDFLKVDYCGGQQLKLDERTRYTAIKNAILNTGRNVNYNVCRWQFPGTWVTSIADSWRMSTDINFSPGSTASWSSVVNIINQNKYLAPYASPGHYNDMDMLEVGRGLTFEEDKSHFTMWCMLSSPLILGCNLTTISSQTKLLLTNSEVIGVNQDTTGPSPQAYLISEKNNLQVWAKKLNGRQSKERAVALFNQSSAPAIITIKWKDLYLVGPATVRDIWAQTNLGTMDSMYSTTVPAHGVILLKVVGAQTRLQETFEGEYAWLNNFNLTQFAAVVPDQARASADAACSGGAKASYVGNRSDNYMEFRDVYADVSGSYHLTLTYISGENRSATVQLNGKDTLLSNLNSGGWGTLKNITFPVSLKKGYNIIRISNATGWVPDVDKIYIDLNKYNVIQNVSPVVNLTSPANNSSFTSGGSINLTATASDADGTVSNVQFYNGTTLLGSDATSPYSFTWSNVAAGTYALTARATDNAGSFTTSAAVTLIVNSCTPSAITPYVQINGGAWTQGSSATLVAGGTVTFGPQPVTGGSWSWTGPSGFTSTTREITLSTIQTSQAGNYTSNYTNASGCNSTQSFSVTVNVPVPVSTTIQCETACTVDGTLNETFNAGFRGTGYVNTDNFLGASATWYVNSQTAQTISLGIRYAHTTVAGRSMSLSVNGVTQVANIAFGPTASNTTWVVSTVQITLAAGVNTIKFVSTTAQGSPYMDELVYGGTVSPGSCPAVRMSALPATTVQSSIAPNPSADVFNLTVQESVQSFTIVNDMGIVVSTGSSIEEGGSVSLGQALPSGLYIVRIQYVSGKTETIKIQKSR